MTDIQVEIIDTTTPIEVELVTGAPGTNGVGVPAGGTTGQVLAKDTDADYDTEWVDQTGGGGAVDSVNGDTGIVVVSELYDPTSGPQLAVASEDPFGLGDTPLLIVPGTAYTDNAWIIADLTHSIRQLGIAEGSGVVINSATMYKSPTYAEHQAYWVVDGTHYAQAAFGAAAQDSGAGAYLELYNLGNQDKMALKYHVGIGGSGDDNVMFWKGQDGQTGTLAEYWAGAGQTADIFWACDSTGSPLFAILAGGAAELTEQSDPSAAAANKVRVYAKNTGGVSRLYLRDDTAVKQIAVTTDIPTVAGVYLPLVAGGAAVEDLGAVESNVNTVAATGSTETLDTSVYAVHDCTMDQNCTFTFSNPAPSGKNSTFMLILRGAFTPTLPASVKWSGGVAPTYTTPSVYVFTTVDAGTTWLGQQVGKAFA